VNGSIDDKLVFIHHTPSDTMLANQNPLIMHTASSISDHFHIFLLGTPFDSTLLCCHFFAA